MKHERRETAAKEQSHVTTWCNVHSLIIEISWFSGRGQHVIKAPPHTPTLKVKAKHSSEMMPSCSQTSPCCACSPSSRSCLFVVCIGAHTADCLSSWSSVCLFPRITFVTAECRSHYTPQGRQRQSLCTSSTKSSRLDYRKNLLAGFDPWIAEKRL